MAVAITADLYGGNVPPAVLVTITGLTGVDLVNVTREPPGAPARIVRGGLDVVPTSTTLLLVDVEPELGRPLVYVVSYLTTGASVPIELSADPVTVPEPTGGRHHVLSDAYTGEALVLDVEYDDDERTQGARSTILLAQGQKYPIGITDVRQAETGNLAIYTRDRAETLALADLLDDGRPIVSRHVNDGCDIPALEILLFGDASRRRRSRQGDRRWGLPFQVVDTPDPTLAVVLVTLQDIDDFYSPSSGDLADIASDFATLLDLASDDFGVA